MIAQQTTSGEIYDKKWLHSSAKRKKIKTTKTTIYSCGCDMAPLRWDNKHWRVRHAAIAPIWFTYQILKCNNNMMAQQSTSDEICNKNECSHLSVNRKQIKHQRTVINNGNCDMPPLLWEKNTLQ